MDPYNSVRDPYGSTPPAHQDPPKAERKSHDRLQKEVQMAKKMTKRKGNGMYGKINEKRKFEHAKREKRPRGPAKREKWPRRPSEREEWPRRPSERERLPRKSDAKPKVQTIELLSDDSESSPSSCYSDRAKFHAHRGRVGTDQVVDVTVSFAPRTLWVTFELKNKPSNESKSLKIPYGSLKEYGINRSSAPFWVAIRAEKEISEIDYDCNSEDRTKRYFILYLKGRTFEETQYEKVERRIKCRIQHYSRPFDISIDDFEKYGIVADYKKSANELDIYAQYATDSGHIITISPKDLERLKPEEFLNDTLIDFYLKFLYHERLQNSRRQKLHVFSSFFFTRYRDSDVKLRYQMVRKWTKNVDIFKKDWIFIPIHANVHWSLMVICFPGNVGKQSQQKPCLMYFDSLLTVGASKNISKLVRNYLTEESAAKRKKKIAFTEENIPTFEMKVPQQGNSSDCGLYLLQFAECFARSPLPPNSNKGECRKWFDIKSLLTKRTDILNLLGGLRGKN